MKIGFAGMGTMGFPMATNLGKADHDLVVLDPDLDSSRLETAIPSSRQVFTVKHLTESCEVLISCLPNDQIVRDFYLGPDGVLHSGMENLICCDTSTISPELAVEIFNALKSKGISHLQAPMLGSQPQAVDGTLFFIVSGLASVAESLSPLFETMGKQYMFVGSAGMGNRIKLIHNALGAVNSVAVAESLALCIESGVDPTVFCQVVNNGGGMAWSTYFERRAERVASGHFEPTFSLNLMLKDVSMAHQLALNSGVPVPILEETLKAYSQARELNHGVEDFSAVSKVMEEKMNKSLFGKKE